MYSLIKDASLIHKNIWTTGEVKTMCAKIYMIKSKWSAEKAIKEEWEKGGRAGDPVA